LSRAIARSTLTEATCAPAVYLLSFGSSLGDQVEREIMSDYANRTSRIDHGHEAATATGRSPGKHTLVEQAYASGAAVQRRAVEDSHAVGHAAAPHGIAAPVSASPPGDRIQHLFGRPDVSSARGAGARGSSDERNGEPAEARTLEARTQPPAEARTPGNEGSAAAEHATATPPTGASVSASDAPTAYNIIPHDRNPLSSPGERIIFGAVYTDPSPGTYQLVFTCAGGDFNSAGSGVKSGTFPGINKRNLDFYVPATWNKTSAITVKLELQKVADSSVVNTVNWTFGPKVNIPTTIAQQETDGERALGSIYTYKVGPDVGGDGNDDYLHETVLESFGTRSSNLTVAELKPAWATSHGITTDQQITDYFFGTSSDNGTFTISAGDIFQDQHGGGIPDKARFEEALTTMKNITCDLPQTYSANPGTALGRYTVQRLLKTGGEMKLKKSKNP
jgi:hypothetical protein